MAKITLDFAYGEAQIYLERTAFEFSSETESISVRGKTPGAYHCAGCFQWTPAVKAVCVLFLQSLSRSFITGNKTAPLLSGRRGSLACSLDYAIDKEPQWLCDMFGLDPSGKSHLRRLIVRSNPGGKRPGPVFLSINESVLPAANIRVLINSMPVTDQVSLDSIIGMLSNEPSPRSVYKLQNIDCIVGFHKDNAMSGKTA